MLFGLLWPNTCFEMYFHCKYPSPIQQVLKTLFDWRSHLRWKVCHVNIKLLIWDYFIKCCTLFCKLSVWKTVKITGLQILCSIPCISYDDLPRRLKPVYKGSNPTLATWKKNNSGYFKKNNPSHLKKTTLATSGKTTLATWKCSFLFGSFSSNSAQKDECFGVLCWIMKSDHIKPAPYLTNQI